ncbi:hypothetical protein ELY33_00940 [Vreelandella andesensis]|uniref:VWA domain-containing protein n=1 Tax=Vreelandella andesensis TaxID=447567 RepID=A0A433KYJ9_9GAMM|nr:hypothetical protein [Halomonas andesensis]RUR34776.1 hypothetical protein ELY33_00940 [Halomonas andesensis]
MSRRRSYRRRKGAKSTGLGIMLIIITIVGFAVLIYFWQSESKRPGINQTTLCPEHGPVEHLAILIDTTDPLSMTQLQAARQKVEKIIHDAPVGSRVSFSTVSPNNTVRQSSFYSICKPPTGESASFLTQNPKIIESKYRKEFFSPINSVLDSLLTLESADSSPIMEGLQEFITKIPEFSTTNNNKEIVIISDLIQHSSDFSFYRGLSWESFNSNGSVDQLSRNLGGVKITILRIPRNLANKNIVDDFWVRYFEAQGISRVNAYTIGNL